MGLRTIMKGLLGIPQVWVWERQWKRLLRELLDTYKGNRHLAFLTMDHLSGEDQSKGQDQADRIPVDVLKGIKEMALKAFSSMPAPGAPSEDLSSI